MINNKSQLEYAVNHLETLIALPSTSKNEEATAAYLYSTLMKEGVLAHRYLNNVWAMHKNFEKSKPVLILNSHHDTVKPNVHYTNDPYEPIINDGKIFGLGSNDAGASLVSLLMAFLNFKSQALPFNLVFVASAEEEISGINGITALLQSDEFKHSIDNIPIMGAIVGEPTNMEMAVAERGLMVIDATNHGKSAHIANDNGENAIYKAMHDIQWLQQCQFEKHSALLGPVKISVSSIHTPNSAHNVVPDVCNFIIDVRLNECYTHEAVLTILQQKCNATLVPRSMRLKSTNIPLTHPIVAAGLAIGLGYYGSQTLSDKALMPFPALKCGPGKSERSHTADEFVFIHEIDQAILLYTALLKSIKL